MPTSPLEVAHPAATEVIVARGITHPTRGSPVLRDANLTVRSGEAVLLVGLNGAGKSTFLRLLAGVERPDAGGVRIVHGDSLAEPHLARKRIGYVAQDPQFDPELSVQETVVFAARCAGLHTREAGSIVDSMLQLFDLFDLRRRLPDQLARGERQRLALARALAPDPEVLLLDEPVPHLDGPTQTALIEMLFELKAMGKTCVVATHSPWTFVDWADTLAHLVDGQLRVDSVDRFRSPGPGMRIVRIGVLGDPNAVVARIAPPAIILDVLRDELPPGASTVRVELTDDPNLVATLVRDLVTGGVPVVDVFQESPTLVGIE